MRMKVHIIIEQKDAALKIEELICLERNDLTPETLGLTLNEGKESSWHAFKKR